jgi:DNA transformation protein
MPVSDDFPVFLIDQFSEWGEVTSRKMFGGAGLYRDGKMFGLVSDDVAYLKVDDSNREDFEKAGSSPFRPYADKDRTMSYYEIPPDVLESPVELGEWASHSFAIQTQEK